MLVWGGEIAGEYLSTGGCYNPATDRWYPTATIDVPEGRDFSTSVWTGSLMIVWGGLTDDFLASGGRYSYVDTDGDGVRDSSDCAPSDASLYSLPTVTGLKIAADTISLSWDSGGGPGAGGGITYDVLRGSLAELPVGGKPSETCLASPITSTTVGDPPVPGQGSGFWYLVRGRNACGAGAYGTRSDGQQILSSLCP
jgi:hypothetical protein